MLFKINFNKNLKHMRFTLIFVISCLSLALQAQDPNFHIYLCFGQSNMEGHAKVESRDSIGISQRFKVMQTVDCGAKTKGEWYQAVPPLTRCHTGLSPADYFGRTMLEQLPENITIGIINVSVGGCKIELFDKDGYEAYVQSSPDWLKNTVKQYDGNPYGRLIEMAKIAQKQGVIKGILMHQGESNNGDSTWPSKVKKVYDNIHVDLQLAPNTLPLLAGELVNFDQNGACAGMNAIIATLKDYIPKAHIVPSQGCEGVPDRLHFSAAGYRELGRRYAATMLGISK